MARQYARFKTDSKLLAYKAVNGKTVEVVRVVDCSSAYPGEFQYKVVFGNWGGIAYTHELEFI